MPLTKRRLLLFLPLLLIACSGGERNVAPQAATPTVMVESTATAIPQARSAPPGFKLEPDLPNGGRIRAIVAALSVDIGPRPAGSAKERQAADYIAGLLRSYGYEVELQEFPIGREVARESTLAVKSPESRTVSSVPLSNSAAASAIGRTVFGGLGTAAEIPADARGAILLLRRGDLTFQQKVENAQASGARGVIIFNNEPGSFFGTLASPSSIPAVSISLEQGEALVAQLLGGDVQVEVSVGEISDAKSQNVIARPPGKECETVSGGHYDSVPVAPGASDNASGTATVIEVAALIASHGEMASNCFVLWGAEELGLIGSRAFVASLDAADRARLKAVLNFDMVGVGEEGWLLAGSAGLQQRAQAIAQSIGMPTMLGQLPANTGSDHASFISAGIAAVMLHRTNDGLLHTPQDAIDRVRPELLEEAARLGVTMLETLNRGS